MVCRRAAWLLFATLFVALLSSTCHGWSSPTSFVRQKKTSFRNSIVAALYSSAVPITEGGEESAAAPAASSSALPRKEQLKQQALKEGGFLTFNTKFGALNPFAIYYGLTSIFLGLFWFAALTGCQLLYFLSRGRIDRRKRLPTFFTQVWGETLMFLTRCAPTIENRDILKEYYKKGQAAMICANHNSWMDIPFLGYTAGWKNYKLVSKAELGKVPILGKAIKVGGHVMVDRSSRRSQLQTLKDGMKWLKDGVHLCTYPEGTRSKSGRLGKFKNGSFKMAHKTGAPVIPLSIVGSAKAMPHYWMFPMRPSNFCKVVVHEPIASDDKTEEELAQAVRDSIIEGLPNDQKP